MHGQVRYAKVQGATHCQARRDQILDHLLLTVDNDRAAAGKSGHVDPMALAAKPKLDPVML